MVGFNQVCVRVEGGRGVSLLHALNPRAPSKNKYTHSTLLHLFV